MKYILLMNTMKANSPGFTGWSKEEIRAHIQHMLGLNEDLRVAGELVSVEALSFPDRTKLVRAGNDGLPVTDGVFPESKEFLAGYWIVDVSSPERAYQIAARASAAPRPRDVALNMPIEVRPVMSVPPQELL